MSSLHGPGSRSRSHLADRLMAIGAIKFKGPDNPDGFKLKLHETYPDRPLSPIFLNLRDRDNPKPGMLTDHEYDMAAHLFCELIAVHELEFDAIAPLPRAGDPFGRALAKLLRDTKRPTLLLELEKEDLPDGKRRIRGATQLVDGLTVLVLDDLITGAESKLEGIEALESQGAQVCSVITLVDREQGGRTQLMDRGISLNSVFTISELLSYYVTTNALSPAVAEDIFIYLRN